jgi:hypothetical protein
MLRDSWSEVAPPSPDAQDRARSALLARITEAGPPAAAGPVAPPGRTGRGRVWAWRAGIATAAAAAVAASVVVFGGNGPDARGPVAQPDPTSAQPGSTTPAHAQPMTAVAQAFELAATHAAAQPFTPPRPDQWIYIELQQILASNVAGTKGTPAVKTVQTWKRADGQQTAYMVNGTLQIGSFQQGSGMPAQDYPTLAGLPTDPDALLAWLRTRLGPSGDDILFTVIATIVGQNLLPPDVAAAALRAAALVPGVAETPESTTIDGHPVTALGRALDGWRQFDILVDSDTQTVIGSRNIAIADYQDPNGYFAFSKGQVMDMVLLKKAIIVDAAGHTS